MNTLSIQTMEALKQEHDSVVKYIENIQKVAFDVLTNIDSPQYNIGGILPDMILIDKNTKLPAFIIEVKRNGDISKCILLWKTIPQQITLYIIVPTSDLVQAKSFAIVNGLKVRFGNYDYADGNVINVNFE
jgi:hypothetical protein